MPCALSLALTDGYQLMHAMQHAMTFAQMHGVFISALASKLLFQLTHHKTICQDMDLNIAVETWGAGAC